MQAIQVFSKAIQADVKSLNQEGEALVEHGVHEYLAVIFPETKLSRRSTYSNEVARSEWSLIKPYLHEGHCERIRKAIESNVYKDYIESISRFVLSAYGNPEDSVSVASTGKERAEILASAKSDARKWLSSRSKSIFCADFEKEFKRALLEDFDNGINQVAYWDDYRWLLDQSVDYPTGDNIYLKGIIELLIMGALYGHGNYLADLPFSRTAKFSDTHIPKVGGPQLTALSNSFSDDKVPSNLVVYLIDFIDREHYGWVFIDGAKYQISPTESAVVGRNPEINGIHNSIPIPISPNENIGRQHFVIKNEDSHWIVESLSISKTKLIRNGIVEKELGKTESCRLMSGDVLLLNWDVEGVRVEFV